MNKYQFTIGDVSIGGNNPISIQSMSDIKTENISENIALTNDLAKRGLQLMRFSVLDEKDALALKVIKKNVDVPIISDIHFSPKLAFLSLESGVDKIRINPGNFPSLSLLRELIRECKRRNVAIRIGVNAGSLNAFKGKTKSRADDMLLALDDTLKVFQEEDFTHLVLSLKSSDPDLTEELYLKAYEKYPYPLHVGLTESGLSLNGSIRSTYALTKILQMGIGDTLRISLADERKYEIRACKELLKLTGRRENVPTLIVCPSCGRTLIDLKEVANEVQDRLDFINKDIKVAVMGCPVNGIGEAKDAYCGIAGSGKKEVYLYFEYGKEVGLFEKEEAINRLFKAVEEA